MKLLFDTFSVKIKFFLCPSIDCYGTDPVGQATYHDGYKITFSHWQKWIRTVECGVLAINKTFVKILQIELYPVFFKHAHWTRTGKRKRKRNLI